MSRSVRCRSTVRQARIRGRGGHWRCDSPVSLRLSFAPLNGKSVGAPICPRSTKCVPLERIAYSPPSKKQRIAIRCPLPNPSSKSTYCRQTVGVSATGPYLNRFTFGRCESAAVVPCRPATVRHRPQAPSVSSLASTSCPVTAPPFPALTPRTCPARTVRTVRTVRTGWRTVACRHIPQSRPLGLKAARRSAISAGELTRSAVNCMLPGRAMAHRGSASPRRVAEGLQFR